MIWYDDINDNDPSINSNIWHLVWKITDWYMYGPLLAPISHPTLESVEDPLSSLRKGRRRGRPVPGHALVQFCSNVWHLSLCEFSIRTKYWPAHVHLPTCPYAWPILWECWSSTFLPWERPAPGQAGTSLIYWFKLIEVCVIYEHILYKLRIIQSIDMYICPLAPMPDQSLENAEAPLSSLGKGWHQGRLAHNHASVQSI